MNKPLALTHNKRMDFSTRQIVHQHGRLFYFNQIHPTSRPTQPHDLLPVPPIYVGVLATVACALKGLCLDQHILVAACRQLIPQWTAKCWGRNLEDVIRLRAEFHPLWVSHLLLLI